MNCQIVVQIYECSQKAKHWFTKLTKARHVLIKGDKVKSVPLRRNNSSTLNLLSTPFPGRPYACFFNPSIHSIVLITPFNLQISWKLFTWLCIHFTNARTIMCHIERFACTTCIFLMLLDAVFDTSLQWINLYSFYDVIDKCLVCAVNISWEHCWRFFFLRLLCGQKTTFIHFDFDGGFFNKGSEEVVKSWQKYLGKLLNGKNMHFALNAPYGSNKLLKWACQDFLYLT